MPEFYTAVGRLSAAPTVPATFLLVVAGATKGLLLTELDFGSHNASAIAGSEISIGRPTTSGTGGVAVTPQPLNPNDPASIFTALSGATVFSAEPTQPAAYVYRFPLDVLQNGIWVPQKPIYVPVNTRLAFRVEIDNSATKVQWAATATFQE